MYDNILPGLLKNEISKQFPDPTTSSLWQQCSPRPELCGGLVLQEYVRVTSRFRALRPLTGVGAAICRRYLKLRQLFRKHHLVDVEHRAQVVHEHFTLYDLRSFYRHNASCKHSWGGLDIVSEAVLQKFSIENFRKYF